MIQVISYTEWCDPAYAVYWINMTCDWIIQGIMCNYDHAVEYIKQLNN